MFSQEFYCRDRKNFNLQRFRDKLRSSQWEDLYELSDLDRANNWFEQNLRNIIQEECPLKIVQPNKKLKNWIKPETKNKIKDRDTARKLAQQSDTNEAWSNYKILRNQVTSMSRDDKKSHFHQLYENMQKQNNIKGLYRTIKTQLGWKNSGPPQSLDVEGRKLTAPRDIANAQMTYLKKKIEKLMSEIPRPTEDPLKTLQLAMDRWGCKAGNREIFSLKEVCVGDILAIINKMGNSSALSHDFIDAISIKAASEILAPPITFLTNLSIGQSKLQNPGKKLRLYQFIRERRPVEPLQNLTDL